MRSILAGKLTVTVSPDGFNQHSVSRDVSLTLDFSADGSVVTLLSGWPTILFDNSAPLSPASRSLRVSLSSLPGIVDPAGHVALPIVLRLDYEPNFVFGKRDLDFGLALTSSPTTRIWERAPLIGLSGSVTYPPAHSLTITLNGTVNPLPAPYPSPETVWFDGVLPDGAIPHVQNERPFAFDVIVGPGGPSYLPLPPGYPPDPGGGRQNSLQCHNSRQVEAGTSQHFFDGARQTLAVAQGERLFAYIYLDAGVREALDEIMLQWNDGTWEHRAFWGANIIPWGVTDTFSRRRIGDLPQADVWTRLEVLASDVGLEGRTLNGMAFTVNGIGPCLWSRAGKLHV